MGSPDPAPAIAQRARTTASGPVAFLGSPEEANVRPERAGLSGPATSVITSPTDSGAMVASVCPAGALPGDGNLAERQIAAVALDDRGAEAIGVREPEDGGR
jgi:hypothetical protein